MAREIAGKAQRRVGVERRPHCLKQAIVVAAGKAWQFHHLG